MTLNENLKVKVVPYSWSSIWDCRSSHY